MKSNINVLHDTYDGIFFLSAQHFAEEINNLNYSGSTGLSNQMKTFYEKTLIELASPNLIHDQFAQKKNIPANSGKSIEFRKFESLGTDLEALVLYENIIPDGQDLVSTDIVANICETGGYVKVGDTFQLTAIDPVLVQATKKIAEQASIVADKITRERMMEGTNVIFANGGVSRHTLTADNTIKLADIFKAAAQLKGANAPSLDGSFVAIIHPYTSFELMQEDGVSNTWLDISKYKNAEKIYNGELGKVGGVRFVESTQAKIFRGRALAADGSRTLTATAATGGKVTVSGAEAGALVGRYVIIGGQLLYVTANTATQLTVVDPDDHVTAVTPTVNNSAVVYPGEGGAEGISVYATVIMGADAYATTGIGDGGIEHITHDKSQIGGPLNQFSTVGWKLRKTAEILVDEYMVRLESCSKTFPNAEAN